MATLKVDSNLGAIWADTTAYVLNNVVYPTDAYGTADARKYSFVCTQAGTSGGTEPTWVISTPDFSTTNDGTAKWQCRIPDSWAEASLNLARCFQYASAGDIVHIDDGSAYAYVANTIYASAGTVANPIRVYSVDKADDSYSIGATEDFSGGSYRLYPNGSIIFNGVVFKFAGGYFEGADADNNLLKYVDCSLEGMTGSFSLYLPTMTGGLFYLVNTNISIAGANSGISINNGIVFSWEGGSLTGDVNELIESHNKCSCVISGVDLSSMIGGAIFNGFGGSGDDPGGKYLIEGCKLNGSPPSLVTDTSPAVRGVDIKMINCNSGNTPYFQEHKYEGDIYHESSIYRAGADPSSNNFSARMVSSAGASYDNPLRYELCPAIWATANPQIVVEILHDSEGIGTGDVFEKQEFWIEIERPTLNNAAFRDWDRTNKETPLVTGNDNGTDAGVSWTETSGGITAMTKPVEQRITEQIAGGHAGIHTIWLCLAVPSITIYACPQIDVTYP